MRPETVQLLKNLALGIGLLSVLGLLLWGVWHVVRLPALTITQVVVSGGETINHEAIQLEVERLLEGDYWRFIPRRFTLTYPEAEILAAVSATPRVKDPVLVRQGRVVRVRLAEFEPVALWCEVGRATTSPCVFLDQNGYGFARAPTLDGGAFTRFSRIGQSATTSAVFADGGDFAQLRELEQLLGEFSWPVMAIELDQARDAFVYLVGGGELKVTLGLTPAATLDNLRAVLTAEQYQHLSPGQFHYVDLRFGNKVFVNEFGAPVEELEATVSSSTASITETATSE